jgi:hypothetical protein
MALGQSQSYYYYFSPMTTQTITCQLVKWSQASTNVEIINYSGCKMTTKLRMH